MKLIDILVRELKSWPDHIHCMTQDSNGDLNWHNNKCSPELNDEGVTWKCDESWVYYFHGYETADDWEKAIITRDQYETALAASQKPAWNSEGLPPVGCEYEVMEERERSVFSEWTACKVIHFNYREGNESQVFITDDNGDFAILYGGDGYKFRPLRTEADKKRDEAAKEMLRNANVDYNRMSDASLRNCLSIYDAIAAGKIPGVKVED